MLYDSKKRICKQLLESLLFEQILSFTEMIVGMKRRFTFHIKESEVTVEGRRGPFDRIRLDISTLRSSDRSHVNDWFDHLLTQLPISDDFQEELRRTHDFDELSQRHRLGIHRAGLDYEELEKTIIEGHPYHPCFKSRIGFSQADHEAYGPEAGNRFQLHWVALLTPLVQGNGRMPIREILGGQKLRLFLDKLEKMNRVDYQILPVHPWQWSRIKQEVAQVEGVDLGEGGVLVQATQSIRTVFCPGHPELPHIKLPLDLKQTSAIRTFSVPNVVAAPTVSDWLKKQASELPVTLLSEFASCVGSSGPLAGRVGCVFRENVLVHTKAEEQVIPLTALAQIEVDGRHFLGPWLERYGHEKWLRRFFIVYLEPIIRLVTEKGIGVEAHAQNTLLVLRDGWSERIILRDFHDSIEFVSELLDDRADVPDFKKLHPDFDAPINTYYEMSHPLALRESLYDTLFVYHLTELSCQLEQTENLSETTFFDWIHQTIEGLPIDRERLERIGWYAPRLTAEALLAPRFGLTNQINVKNSLVQRGEENDHAMD
ncbi:hypothetical protein OVA29_13795 [Exiguobacterium sp. SL14]|nr:IucA/IucC family protein [Exiguobacterium sp. SL14]MCY1691622.1 hypothetical protein [Exiguobacterium sp. SL14]